MKGKPGFKINIPEINIYILIIGITSLILLFYNLYVGCLFFFIFIYIVFHNWRISNFRKKEWNKYIENLSLDIDETTKKAIMNLPIPLCILEFDGNISWYNKKFYEMTESPDLLDFDVKEYLKSFEPSEQIEKILSYNNKLKEYIRKINLVEKDNELTKKLEENNK